MSDIKNTIKEWSPESQEYTDREIEKEIAYVLRTKDVPFWSQEEIDKYGFQII